MSNPICFEFGGKNYTLEFNRRTAEMTERKFGFNIIKIITDGEISITSLPDLFYCSFLAHHPYISKEKSDEIFAFMEDKGSLMSELVLLLSEPVIDVMAEPDEGNVIRWKRAK